MFGVALDVGQVDPQHRQRLQVARRRQPPDIDDPEV